MKSPPSGPVSAPQTHNTPRKKRPLPSPPSNKLYKTDDPVPPPQHEHEVDMDTLWQEAEEMRGACNDVDTDSEDDEDTYGYKRKQRPVMTKLPDGDIHVCMAGIHCPFLVANDDNLLVCKFTGVMHGSESIDEFFDLCGGIGKKSGDPDANCGEPVYGKFVKRVDPLAASKSAFQAAKQFEDSDITGFVNCTDTCDRKPLKRGALCVGEVVASDFKKRQRTNKKCVENRHTCNNLVSEAESVYCKLINFDKCASYDKKLEGERGERKKAPMDPRMKNAEFVRTAAIKRYAKQCVLDNVSPCLDEIHNLCIQAQTIAKQARESEVDVDEKATIRTASFKSAVSNLVVSLWIASCGSPYMLNSPKRGTDAFRPFVCGILYAMKRGLRLSDGSIIVPQCNIIASALPVLRGTGGNASAKTLHSSSHRGICTLSRCISSVPVKEQREHFLSVIRAVERFSSHKFTSSDI